MQILDSQSNHMALDTVVYPQQDPLACNFKDFCASGWGYDSVLQQNDIDNNSIQQGNILNGNYYDYSSSSVMKEWDPNSSPEACTAGDGLQRSEETAAAETVSVRRKRRRTRSCKNKEELESQRMTHIAVERNRRKQMNEYLATIRSLMPPSYVQRGDQASIVGGAINFVKELEQQLQTIEAERRANIEQLAAPNINKNKNSVCGQVFGEFFTYPQYKRSSNNNNATSSSSSSSSCSELILGGGGGGGGLGMKEGFGDIEVNMVESHANMKIMTKKRPKQLLKIVAALQCFYLTILHLNVTTVHHLVLYTISLKLEEGCQLTTVEEIADLVNHLLGRIEEESVFS